MATAKHKKLDKMTAINFVANFCAIFALIYVVALLMLANVFGTNRPALASLSASTVCSSVVADSVPVAVPAVLFPVSADNPSESAIKIVIDDGGWAPKQIDLSLSSSRVMEITNKGVNEHSFVIDDLGIDSGAIAPGNAKTVYLQNLSSGAAYYIFYSNMGSDDGNEAFSGILTIK